MLWIHKSKPAPLLKLSWPYHTSPPHLKNMLWCKCVKTKFADFPPPRHRFGVARRPLTCDCNLSVWHVFALYKGDGCVCRQFDRSWQIFDKVSSISQSREVWILGLWTLSASRHDHFWLQTAPHSFHDCNLGLKSSYISLYISLSALVNESHFSSQEFLKPTQLTDIFTLLSKSGHILDHGNAMIFGWGVLENQRIMRAESLQDDDYHIFGLAVLGNHEWMVLRRIGNESGTRRVEALQGNNDRPVQIFLQTGELEPT